MIRDDDPASGFKTLARTEQGQDYTVDLTTALGRLSQYEVQTLATGDQKAINTDPAGLRYETTLRQDGTHSFLDADGTITNETLGPDPRWSMQTPLTTNSTVTTPASLTVSASFGRTASLSNPANPLSLTSLNDTLIINGQTYTGIYNAATRTHTTTSPLGREITGTIDAQGRPTQSQVEGLLASSLSYDPRGRLANVTQGSGIAARASDFTYNTQGFLEGITDPLGRTYGLIYDGAGRLLTQTLPDNRVIQLSYDANGNLVSITPPGRPAHTFDYTPVDLTSEYNPPAVTGGGTNQTVYAYNVDRQLDLITRPDGQTLDYTYDSAGRLRTLTAPAPAGVYTYTYSPTSGNLTSIAAPGGETVAHTYDGSLLKDTSWTGTVTGAVNRRYDNNFQVRELSVNGNPVLLGYDIDRLLNQAGALVLTRDPQHGLVTATTLDTVTDSSVYNGFGEPASYSASGGAAPRYDAQYTRDKLGRITEKTESLGGVTDTFAYTYDLAGRLTEVKKNGTELKTGL